MTLEILPEALEEMESAFLFYESQVPRLGLQFLSKVGEGFHRILLNPLAWALSQEGSSKTYRCLVRTFPFGLIYKINEKKIIVVAVMHLSRKPGYWKKRKGFQKGHV
jgi:plasmid stabilization system protein ParE